MGRRLRKHLERDIEVAEVVLVQVIITPTLQPARREGDAECAGAPASPRPPPSAPPSPRPARARRPASSFPGRRPACARVAEAIPGTGSGSGGLAFKFLVSRSIAGVWCRWNQQRGVVGAGQGPRSSPGAPLGPARPHHLAVGSFRGASASTGESFSLLVQCGFLDPLGRVGEGLGGLRCETAAHPAVSLPLPGPRS